MNDDSSPAAPSEDAVAGQAVYSPRVLRMYDWFVLGLSNRFIWRCATRRLEGLYAQHVTGNHLDVGVGTGYFLDRCRFPTDSPRVVLMDLNQNCLDATAARIARYRPTSLKRNVLEPVAFDGAAFDSIALNYVLHCLPGRISEKAVVFDHLGALAAPGGVLFGATILGTDVPRNVVARRLMKAYNQRRVFSNADDSLTDLKSELDDRFGDWNVDVVGCVALFWARTNS